VSHVRGHCRHRGVGGGYAVDQEAVVRLLMRRGHGDGVIGPRWVHPHVPAVCVCMRAREHSRQVLPGGIADGGLVRGAGDRRVPYESAAACWPVVVLTDSTTSSGARPVMLEEQVRATGRYVQPGLANLVPAAQHGGWHGTGMEKRGNQGRPSRLAVPRHRPWLAG
jgi:hypothetical protein